MNEKPTVLLLGPPKPVIVEGLSTITDLRILANADDPSAFIREIADDVRGIAIGYVAYRADADLMARFPKLEIVSTFGVGYDHVDVVWASEHGVIVTNTPDVLTDEVADTTVGLLLSVVRELSQAERYLRAGKWVDKPYPLTPSSLRERKIGLVGMGRIGKAIARRLKAFDVPVACHTRRQQADLDCSYYPRLIDMAREVDTLILIVPGGADTRHLVDDDILRALGPKGVLINMARGSVVDEAAMIKALADGTILAAGLDVFQDEPNVRPELLAMDNVVLLPHVGSRSAVTHAAMDQLVVDNILAWASGRPPLTPVLETPFTPKHGVSRSKIQHQQR